MSRELLTGNVASAWSARLAEVDYIPAYPITPQTEIVETLASWVDTGAMDARMTMLDSEHAMLTAAGAGAATGARVFTATSSQGLLYAMEMLYTVAGWRVPFVMANVSRGLATPITLEPDHNDVLAARDSGFLQLHAASCQEVLDLGLLAFRLAEHPRVRLPVLVNLDGFHLSFTREPVSVPPVEQVRELVPPFDSGGLEFKASAPKAMAVTVLGGSPYSYFRYETHLAALAGLDAYAEAAADFGAQLGRDYGPLELHRMEEDPELCFVMIGSFATKARHAVNRLREVGFDVGLVRPRLLRPLPVAALREALSGRKAVAVIDQNLSVGMGGVLYSELASVLYGLGSEAPRLLSYVGGLGGRDIPEREFLGMAKEMREAAVTGNVPPPRLLYRAEELEHIRRLQEMAQVDEPSARLGS
jgi:pyruvate ferredoxin oxidoreductase alpha subunit